MTEHQPMGWPDAFATAAVCGMFLGFTWALVALLKRENRP